MLLADIRPEHVIAARRELAKRSLADFACLVDIPTVPLTDADDEDQFSVMRLDSLVAHHKLLCDSLQALEAGKIPNLMVLMPPGSAKALALDTPIPTPEGWRRMGDLRVGDQVFGDDGRPCNVTWVSPIWRERPVYRVTTDCGDEVIADRDHEWLVRLCGKRQVFKIKETHRLSRVRSKRPMILRAGALDLPDAALPIDPYLLGVWLGDGHSSGLRITASVEDQPWLRGELERLGIKTKDSSVPTQFGVSGVRANFAALGLLHDPAHATIGRKHIPAMYLRASIAQRKALLQGLIDTDGTVCKKRGCATFCNTNREIAEGLRELVRSLGVKAGWSEGPAILNGKRCGTAYRVSFYMRDAARMPRKAALCRDQRRTPDTYIDVHPAGSADTVCIEVDSPSHLFLCGRSMTPTHNSTYTDVVFIPWFMSRASRRHVILASYASDIAEKQGRRARQLINSRSFFNLTGRALRGDQKAAGQWTLDNGSEFMAGGLLSGLMGNRAALGVVDDPIRGRQAAESETVRKSTWEAYTDDFCSRLIPGSPQVMITCMVGDTPVLMADGTEKTLRTIVKGDAIATYEDGRISTSHVLNWRNCGLDLLCEIRTMSGTIVKANKRHPFLVERNGVREWVRTQDLRIGDQMLRAAPGKELCAPSMDAQSTSRAKACAYPTTTSTSGPQDTARHQSTPNLATPPSSSIDTGCMLTSTEHCSPSKTADAQFADSPPEKTCERIGAGNSASTTITTREKLEGFCATTATSQLDTERPRKRCAWPLHTYGIILDGVVEISPAGGEDVFDIEVERTENFIANGLVSHNTRWHEDDVAGRILPEGWDGESGWMNGRDGRCWYVICLPAEADRADDPLGRKIGETLWPQWFSADHWAPFKLIRRTWTSLYQQKPKPGEGDVFKPAMIEIVPALPVVPTQWCRGWDFAGSIDGDWTAGPKLGKMADGRFIVADVQRERFLADKRDALLLNTAKADGTGVRISIPQDPGQAGKSQVLYLTRQLAGFSVHSSPETGDKVTRAEPVASQVNVGNVLMLRGPWNKTFTDELRSFPNGTYDDQVDGLSRAFAQLLGAVDSSPAGVRVPGL